MILIGIVFVGLFFFFASKVPHPTRFSFCRFNNDDDNDKEEVGK